MIIKIDFLTIDFPPKEIKTANDFVLFWKSAKNKINQRVRHFENVFKTASEEAVFAELAFCLFTPQSKAISCWKAVNVLHDKKLLLTGSAREISTNINNVRFHNNKAKYLTDAREKFTINGKISIKNKLSSFKNPADLREWIIENITGIGYKEASHFLRNTGIGLNLAILDRHILRNLKKFKAIDEIPQTLTSKKYLDIEEKMQIFSKKIKIPMSHMDLLMWCMQTGGIFK
ncbi:MAG: N-glycosylase/DNA lyase [Endomicrobiaceae bacterium]